MILSLLVACGQKESAPPFDDGDVAAEVSELVVTVATVTWGESDADAMRVEFGPTADYGHEARGEDGRAVLFGMPPDSTWHYRVVAERAGETFPGDDHTVTTGTVPEEVPVPELLTPGDGAGYVLTSWFGTHSADSAVVVLDEDANVVWYRVVDWGVAHAAKVSADGKSIVAVLSSHDELEDARIVRYAPTGEVEDELPMPFAHHDFLEVPFARYALIVGEVRDVDGVAVVGDRIVEVGEDGAERVVWNAFDHFPVEETAGFQLGYPQGADWTHANSLVYDEATDTYTLSLYMQRCVLRVARESGEQLWTMCADGSGDVVPDSVFGPQHSIELHGDEIAFFDNAYEAPATRIVRFAIDGGAATVVSEWTHPDGLEIAVMGDVVTLPDDRVLTAWGERREMLVNDGDSVDWRARLGDYGVLAQASPFSGF